MPIGLIAMLVIGGLFFAFLLNRLMKLRLSNIDAQVEQVLRGQPVTSPARAVPIQSKLPAARAPAARERELVSVSLFFPIDYKHSAAIIQVKLMHGDTMISTWNLIDLSSGTTVSLTLKGCISENQLPADLTLVAHAIVEREILDLRDCFVDIRPGDFYAETVVLVNADAPTAISVNMLPLPA